AHLLAIAVIHAILYLPTALGWYLITYTWAPFRAEYSRGLVQTTLLYSITAIATLALDHARLARERAARATQLEADLARSRLDTLRRQLQPHFLFNTLNTIAALIHSDPHRAAGMVAQLGELLRRSLDEHEQPLIPISAELEFVRLYAEIEQVRFESWLEVREEVDPAALDAWVPPMLLQPLVENAIRHGIAPSSRKGTIVISARVLGDRLCLEVTDDGAGLDGAGPLRQGVGLGATRERLHHLFSGDARLDLTRRNGTTTASIDLPLIRHVL
ncbi:MAG TPA: histidine kinase, partial [Longimicrobiales bacterium]|nr:histidine kinase [Longimicrobiales bacterium]